MSVLHEDIRTEMHKAAVSLLHLTHLDFRADITKLRPTIEPVMRQFVEGAQFAIPCKVVQLLLTEAARKGVNMTPWGMDTQQIVLNKWPEFKPDNFFSRMDATHKAVMSSASAVVRAYLLWKAVKPVWEDFEVNRINLWFKQWTLAIEAVHKNTGKYVKELPDLPKISSS